MALSEHNLSNTIFIFECWCIHIDMRKREEPFMMSIEITYLVQSQEREKERDRGAEICKKS